MQERLDAFHIVTYNNGNAKWNKIGAAFINKDGKGYRLKLNAMPAPVDGEFVIMLREPLPPRGTGTDDWDSKPSVAEYRAAQFDTDLDDDVPF